MAVASTNTIIYTMYKDHNIPLSREMAGLIFSGILSDTLLLKSPTTTELDKKIVKELEELLNLDYMEYGLLMYKAGVDITGKTIEDVINTDYKQYEVGEDSIGISQVMTLSIENIENNKQAYIEELNKMSKDRNLKIVALFVTDIINNGSYLYYNEESENLVKIAFNIEDIKQGVYLPNYVSRKKQMLPKLLDVLD